MRDWPSVSVVMPVRNDAAGLPAAVDAVLSQGYSGPLELVLGVGPSDDDTEIVARRLAAADPRVRVVDNPAGSTPAALNRAIAAASGEVIARIDAHAEPEPGYLECAVQVLEETRAVNVGGIQLAVGTTPFQRAVATAMSSRFGTGDARFHYGGVAGPSDTVYLGVFRREALEAVGGFDESLLRNQDYELNIRLRAAGGTVWFDPRLRVVYRPRSDLPSLARQYFQYGSWKRLVIRRHPGSARWRQLVPPAAVAANLGALTAGLAGARKAWVVPGSYLAATVAASIVAGRTQPPAVAARLPIVFATMHHAWGLGFLLGRPGRRRVRD
jgi:succinoglycan biosynthesis protein ExoA